jgi:Zn-dependent peptidase ImmA (M78 family)
MERVHSLNFRRIEWCCDQVGITPEQLASDVGISASTMEKARVGTDVLTPGQLRKIASYFGRGVLFFLESSPADDSKVYTAQFRTLANQKPDLSPKIKQIIQRAERQRAIYLSLREDLDDEDRPRFCPPNISGLDLRATAAAARTWLRLKDQRTFDEYRTAVESRGLLVFRSNGYNGKWQIPKDNPILGFSLYDSECPLIVVKKQAAETRQTFTLMHELAHVLLHKMSSIDDEADLYSREGHEREANAFAGSLLVPDEYLLAISDAQRPAEVSQYDAWLEPQRTAWGVSGEVILRRLLDAARLSEADYNGYRTWRNAAVRPQDETGNRMYRHREPKHIFGDTFVRTVLDALNAHQISLARASTYLDSLKISDLHQLERHYADH